MKDLFMLVIGAILVNNFVLTRFLGICPFLGVSKKVETATGMGLAVIFVMTMTGFFCYLINKLILVPLNLEYLQTIVFILVIAALVQLVEMILLKNMPALYTALGIYLPLITTNCCVLAVAVINVQKNFGFLYSVVFAFAAATGFCMAIIIMAGLRERMDLGDVPKSLQGISIGLITSALLSLAFMGFSGLVKG